MIDVSILGPCEETSHPKTNDGHGYTAYAKKTITAHRMAWCRARNIHPNEIKGMVVRHLCDNPACVNINHLELGTDADNMRDKVERGRSADTTGIKNSRTCLTEAQVLEIRARHRENQDSLAAEFKVSRTTIGAIITRQNWKHI